MKAVSAAVRQKIGAARSTPANPDMGKYAKGAAVGGLLGSRGGRQLGGKALKLGSMAAMGMLAWKTYQEWRARRVRLGLAPDQQGSREARVNAG